jgi:anti-anti-sigma regulatory factor
MFAAESDEANRLLSMKFSGRVNAEQMRQCVEKILALLENFQPGFQILTDLVDLDVMDADCAPFIKDMMKACDARGVAAVVRIIPDAHKDIGFNLMTLFHYKPSVSIAICRTRDEAAKSLAIPLFQS